MIDPHQIADARRTLGRQLAAYRKAAGLNQHQLAPKTHYGRSTIANVEVGRQNVPRDFWKGCDEALNAGGRLLAAADRLQTLIRRQHEETTQLAAADPRFHEPPADRDEWRSDADLGSRSPARSPGGSHLQGTRGWPVAPVGVRDRIAAGGSGELWTLTISPGRYFSGRAIPALACAAADDGRVVATVPAGLVEDPLFRRAGHGLLVCMVSDRDGGTCYGLDTRAARRRLARTAAGAGLGVPRGYVLDELTFAVVWAVTNMDEALLGDDAILVEHRKRTTSNWSFSGSRAGHGSAGELSAVSQMWLGSDVCARHILRHVEQLGDAPAFWTREQHGEEASTWLLFGHKYDYLSRLADRFGADAGMRRMFCIPAEAVTRSPAFERTLLVLAGALMESFGVRIEICDDPEYAAVEGFVLDHRRRAVVANWIGADGNWQVDVTDDRPTLREYADILGHAGTRSVTAAATPAGRLRAFAGYLDLDWDWLTRRCAELGEYGVAGVAEPRSRLLSAAGVDRACQYLGAFRQAGHP